MAIRILQNLDSYAKLELLWVALVYQECLLGFGWMDGCLFVQVFHGCHYIGSDIIPNFEEGEAWRKVFGPVFIYLNCAPMGTPCPALWQNAKDQVSFHFHCPL